MCKIIHVLVSSKVSLPHSQSSARISPWRVKHCFSKWSYYHLSSSTWGKTWYSENKTIWKAIFKVIKRCNKLTAWQWLVRFAVVKSTSWSFRGPEFSSQDSHLGTDTHSHLIRAPGRANARASKGTLVHLPTHIYTNEKIKFIKKNSIPVW